MYLFKGESLYAVSQKNVQDKTADVRNLYTVFPYLFASESADAWGAAGWTVG